MKGVVPLEGRGKEVGCMYEMALARIYEILEKIANELEGIKKELKFLNKGLEILNERIKRKL